MKIVTFNLANYNDHPDWDQRVGMIASDFVSLDPDLVAMQEVRFDPNQPDTAKTYRNMAEMVLAHIRADPGGAAFGSSNLVTAISMFYPFQADQREAAWRYPQVGQGEERQYWEGSSILAKPGVPIPVTGNKPLSGGPGTADPNLRSVQYARSHGPGGLLHVFNAHFSYDQGNLESNVAEAVDFMAQFDGPCLLMGDLNATPDNTAFQKLRDAGFHDLWAELMPGDPGYTNSDPKAKNERIDYFWGDDPVREMAKGIRLFGQTPNDDGV